MKFKNLNIMIKPVSSECNMTCKYCFYKDVARNRQIYDFGRMDNNTVDSLISNVFSSVEDNGNITFNFQGGEPLLAGHKYYEYLINKVDYFKKNHNISYNLQTNLTLLDDDYIKLFKYNKFLVGVSIDGPRTINDKYRRLNDRSSSFDLIISNIKKLEANNIEYNILTVLTNELSYKARKLYKFYKNNNFKYIQIIPCLNPINDKRSWGLTPKNFARFYKEFSDVWLEDKMSLKITMLEDVISLLYRCMPLQCGMLGKCSNDMIIEADGSIYPCDFYVLDKYKLAYISDDKLSEIYQCEKSLDFIKEKRNLTKICNSCKYIHICNGNCKRISVCLYDENYCGYKDFLEHFTLNLKEYISNNK
ncbi:MAG: SPASM domain-containing protein [Tissierellia bacterium]|nr:SPASM domain-containing protein [Tissierellia bacterium]